MSWATDALRSRIDDSRRALEEAAQAARVKVDEVAGSIREKAQAVADKATEAVVEGPQYASDVADAAKNMLRDAPAKVAAQVPSPRASAPPARQAKGGDEQRMAETPDDVATPELPAPDRTIGEILRPAGMFAAGLGTGLVSGSLGPLGAGAQMKINADVDAHGSAQDKFAFGIGVELAGAFHIGHGLEMELGAGGGEALTAGAATPVAAAVSAIGILEIGSGAALMASGQALATKGSVSGAAPPRPTQSKLPNGMDDKHILNGEVKYSANGTPKASGFHHRGAGTEGTARIARDARVQTNELGVIKANAVEIKDPRSGQWIRKTSETTLFPDAWDKVRVRKEIYDAYAHRTVVDGNTWTGISSSGVTIEGKVDSTGYITTAYPKF